MELAETVYVKDRYNYQLRSPRVEHKENAGSRRENAASEFKGCLRYGVASQLRMVCEGGAIGLYMCSICTVSRKVAMAVSVSWLLRPSGRAVRPRRV